MLLFRIVLKEYFYDTVTFANVEIEPVLFERGLETMG